VPGPNPAPFLNIRQTAEGVRVAVRLTPKAARDAIEGVDDYDGETVLRARVRALPEDGNANAALEKLIANWLGLPRSTVRLARGTKSRIKHVTIKGNGIALSAIISAKLAEL
jgi:uncharacterized protein (TIGR00251 family)